MDTGPVLLRRAVSIGPEETAGELLDRLAPIGAELLLQAVDGYAAGTLVPEPQDDVEASPAPKITPEETRVDWSAPAADVVNRIRGLSPKPGAWTTYRGKRLILHRARVGGTGLWPRAMWGAVTQPGLPTPGSIQRTPEESMLVATGSGTVTLLEVQPEGKRAMTAEEFARGYRPEAGERLGS